MKALSIKQPWAWLIVNGFKDVENRTWDTKMRGRIAIHAGKSFDQEGYEWVRYMQPDIPLPLPEEYDKGGIVGYADINATTDDYHESPWFFGPYGFILANAELCELIPMRGMLGFFETHLDATTHG